MMTFTIIIWTNKKVFQIPNHQSVIVYFNNIHFKTQLARINSHFHRVSSRKSPNSKGPSCRPIRCPSVAELPAGRWSAWPLHRRAPWCGTRPGRRATSASWAWLWDMEKYREHMAVCQNLVPLVNIKIAGKWMFIPLKMVLIGIDPYPYGEKWMNMDESG